MAYPHTHMAIEMLVGLRYKFQSEVPLFGVVSGV